MNNNDTRVSEVIAELVEDGSLVGSLRQLVSRRMLLLIAEADQTEGVTARQMVEAIEGEIPNIRSPRVASYNRSIMNGTGKLALKALRDAGFVDKKGNRYFVGFNF